MIRKISLLAGAALALAAFNAHAEEIELGESIYSQSCAQCHGRAGAGSGAFPALTGQEEEYIATRLNQYRDGETVGANTALMRGPASALSDEDIAALSVYISTTFQ